MKHVSLYSNEQGGKIMKTKLAKLIDVKSIVTLTLTVVF